MAFFPLTEFDFPNVSNYDGDLRELIYEVRKLMKTYNELVTEMNRLSTRQNDLETAFKALDDKVNQFYEIVAETVKNAVDSAMVVYDAKLANLAAEIDALAGQIDALRATITNFYEMSTNYTDGQIYELSELVFESIRDLQSQIDALQWTLPDVYNIVKGYETDLVTLIYDVYDATRDNALTAGEWDIYGATAAQFDGWQYTAFELDTNAKALLITGKCRNPFTGELDTICNIIQALAQATTTQAITATEYDAAELTADEFNALNLTAFMYDFYAKQFIA